MKITDYKNEDAIDLLADIIEPASKIFADAELKKASAKKGVKMADLAKIALKNNKSAIIEILARLDGKTVEEYECTPVSVLMSVLEILNDKELLSFFQSQGQMMAQNSSGSATENTKAKGSKIFSAICHFKIFCTAEGIGISYLSYRYFVLLHRQ